MPSVADDFHAGRYDAVLRATVDRHEATVDAADVPFAVGALSFTGRLEEASALLRSWLAPGDAARAPGARVAARFHLAVALGRAGRHEEAAELVVEAFRARGPRADDRARFFVHQGLACLRYFRGRMTPAARDAARALGAAVRASFAWGRLLAADLRGHALVQRGDVRAGLASLAQALGTAERLGYDANARAIHAATVVYRARHGLDGSAAYDALEALAAHRPAGDAYTPRIVLLEVAFQRALRGRRDAATEALHALASHALQPDDRRARVLVLAGHALVARLREGEGAARVHLAAARALVAPGLDDALEVELACLEALVLHLGADERARLAARLGALAAATGAGRAAVFARALAGHGDAVAHAAPLCDDVQGHLLAAVAGRGAEAAARVLDEGLFGLVPVALGILPGRRVFLLAGGALLVEDAGEVACVDHAPAQSVELLRALAARPRSKEELVAEVWGLRAYHPERHDAVVHTAISRLRAALGPGAAFVTAHDGAYGLAPGVEVRVQGTDGGSAWATVDAQASPSAAPSASPPSPLERRLDSLVAAARAAPLSTAEAARLGSVSEVTAFRDLALLVERGTLRRIGRGRSTRYALRDDGDPEPTP